MDINVDVLFIKIIPFQSYTEPYREDLQRSYQWFIENRENYRK